MGGNAAVKGNRKGYGARPTRANSTTSAKKFKGSPVKVKINTTTTTSTSAHTKQTPNKTSASTTEVKITDLDVYSIATESTPATYQRTVAPAPKPKPQQVSAPVTVRLDMSVRALNLIQNASQINPFFSTLADFVRKSPGKSLANMTKSERTAIPGSAWKQFSININKLYALGVHHNDVKRSNITWDGHTLRLINFQKAELGVRSIDDLRRAQKIQHYDIENPKANPLESKMAIKDRPTAPVFGLEQGKIYLEFPSDTAKLILNAKGGMVPITQNGNNYKIENKSSEDIYLFRGGDSKQFVIIGKGQSRVATHNDVLQIGQGSYTLRKTTDHAGAVTGQIGKRTVTIDYLPLPPKQQAPGNHQAPISGQVSAKPRQGPTVPKTGDAKVIVANQTTPYQRHRLSPQQQTVVDQWLRQHSLKLAQLTREQQIKLVQHLVLYHNWKSTDIAALTGHAELQVLYNNYVIQPASIVRRILGWLLGTSSGGNAGAHLSGTRKVEPWMYYNIIDAPRNARLWIDGKWVDVQAVYGNQVTYSYIDRSVVPKRRLTRTTPLTKKMLLATFAELPISQIHPTENGLSPIRYAAAHKYTDIPILVYRHFKSDGSVEYYALDGHHRLAVLAKLGRKSVRVRFAPSDISRIQDFLNKPRNPAMPVPRHAKDLEIWQARYDDYRGGPGGEPMTSVNP